MMSEPDVSSEDQPWARDLFRSVFASANVGLVVIQDERIVLANPAAEQMCGTLFGHVAALPPGGFLQLVHPENRERVRQDYEERIRGQAPKGAYLIRILHANGTWRWMRIHPAPVSFRGRPAALAVLVDETDRVEALKKLEAHEQELASAQAKLEARMHEQTRKLRDAAAYIRAVYDNSRDGILVIDAEGRFENGNPACFHILGWPAEEVIGQSIMKVIPPGLHAFMKERWAEVQAGRGVPYETEAIGRDGSRRNIHVSQRHMTIRGERKYAVVITDITELKQAQAELEAHGEVLERKVAERTQALAEANESLLVREASLERAQALAHVGSFEYVPRSGKLVWSREMRRIHGLDPDAPFPPPQAELRALNHPDDVERLTDAMEHTLKDGRPLHCTYRLRLRDGTIRHVVARGERRESQIPDEGYVLAGTVQDVTAQRRLEREIVEVSQREQQRIGAEIHDSLGQELSALSMMSSALLARIETCCPALKDQANRISIMARESVRHARALAHGLTPIDIRIGGLEDELRRLARNTALVYDVDVPFRAAQDVMIHDAQKATHLYRIAREALMNAIRHGRARRIHITLHADAHSGLLSVQDNGRWQGVPADESSGLGLRIMRLRAESIGGRLHIEVATGKGTRITCAFPNAAPPDDRRD